MFLQGGHCSHICFVFLYVWLIARYVLNPQQICLSTYPFTFSPPHIIFHLFYLPIFKYSNIPRSCKRIKQLKPTWLDLAITNIWLHMTYLFIHVLFSSKPFENILQRPWFFTYKYFNNFQKIRIFYYITTILSWQRKKYNIQFTVKTSELPSKVFHNCCYGFLKI